MAKRIARFIMNVLSCSAESKYACLSGAMIMKDTI